MLSDYSGVFGVDHQNPEPITDLTVGELVTVGLSKSPVWRVLAIHGHRAWIARTDRPEVDGLGDIARFRRAISSVVEDAA